jgi:pimeloyl-ACP methyl ester carboxylesterase
MGSFVAQHVAARASERVTKLVLVASATRVRNNTVLELQREIDALKDTAPVADTFARDCQAGTVFSSCASRVFAGSGQG